MPDHSHPATTPIRVLGIDTSLRSTGLGVVERQGSGLRAVAYRAVSVPQKQPHSECLRRIHEAIHAMIEEARPDAASIEGIFHCRNVRTAVTLGQARGVAIAACAARAVPVFEYSPRRMKQSVCGSGAAPKEQVARMVVKMLNLSGDPGSDEADALALAICHLHSMTSIQALAPKAI
jgi:crossover junction endodeoxyribonuclease RuvC